jgi:hypothetical protein
MKRWIWTAAVAALAASTSAVAWNGRGHMIVAAKAWEHLTPRSRIAVGQLLRHNPMFATWTAGVPVADRDRIAFIQAATWPDDIKSSSNIPGYTSDHVTGPNRNRNSGYDDCNQHRYWHYKDQPFSPDGTALRPPPSPNIETQINTFSAVLRDAHATDEVKAYDLVWLIHLVGDAHQPLHATGRFIHADPDGDAGGNDVLVCLSASGSCTRGSALHAFWDDIFGGSENVASVTAFAHGLPDPAAASAAVMTPAAWLGESFALARTQVYRAPIGVGLGPFRLTAGYRSNATRVASARASLAGVRLANLINGAGLSVHGDPVVARSCPAGP